MLGSQGKLMSTIFAADDPVYFLDKGIKHFGKVTRINGQFIICDIPTKGGPYYFLFSDIGNILFSNPINLPATIGFKVGDKVRYTGDMGKIYGEEGIVSKEVDAINGCITVDLDRTVDYFGSPVKSIIGYPEDFDLLLPNQEVAKTENKYPHICIQCNAPCYNGFNEIDCSNAMCKSKVKHV